MATTIETAQGLRPASFALLLAVGLAGCGSPSAQVAAAAAPAQSWSATAWGNHFEVFAEIEPLTVGTAATAHTHVTRRDGSPLAEGEVSIVLAGTSGEQIYAVERPERPGVFAILIEPRSPGEVDLSFRIRVAGIFEDIRGGRWRVGRSGEPGRLLVAPAPRGALEPAEPVPFLKEEQWRSELTTAWIRSGQLARSVAGWARVRPPAGGEILVSSAVDGVVRPIAEASVDWPFVGLGVDRGEALFELAPHIAPDRSLAALESEAAVLAAELATARARHRRLVELLALEAASQRMTEEARTRVATLEARHSAAFRDLEAARASRHGDPPAGAKSATLVLRAPFAGSVARVDVSPGASVTAGEPLARLVRTDTVWLEVSLPPVGARRLAREGLHGVVLTDPESDPLRLEQGLRLVSVAPEVAPRSGTVTVLIEAPGTSGLLLGPTLEAQVLLREEREGIVIPASALVDDAGVDIVYLQLAGESFVRQEIRVLERQGDRLLVEGLVPGQRLVRRGGDAIRRSTLMAGGGAHGHVH